MEATILEITYEKSKFSFFSHRDSWFYLLL
jgi:hypothetical protein